MFAFLAWLLKLAGSGIVDRVLGELSARRNAETDRERIGAEVTIAMVQAEVAARQAVEERRRIEAGHWSGRLILLLIMVPPALYLAAIYTVSIFPGLEWTIVRLPSWMEPMLTALIPGYLGVRGFETVSRIWRRP